MPFQCCAATDAIAAAVAVAEDAGATIAAALLIEGELAKSLLAIAEERHADVIVVGARQDRSVADRLLGTVATEVTKQAHCDVVIVRPVEEAGDLVVPEDPPSGR